MLQENPQKGCFAMTSTTLLSVVHTTVRTSAFSFSPKVATNCERVGLEFSVANKKVTAPNIIIALSINVCTVIKYQHRVCEGIVPL